MIPMEAANSISKGSRVFGIPELLNLICGFACASDCARLSRTCKAAFTVSIPFVWRHVNSAQHLFSLLNKTQKIKCEVSREFKEIVIGTTQFSPVDFSRFDFYASYVRNLSVYGSSNTPYSVDGWKHLVLRAQRQQLLPNLLSITIQTFWEGEIGPDQFIWIKTLISPSLRILKVVRCDDSPFSCIPSPMASALLEVATERCPQLLALSLPSSRTREEALSCRLPFQEYFCALPTLVELTCSNMILEEDALPLIACLPRLQRLTIQDGDDDIYPYTPSLPEESFPALRELHIKKLWTDELEMVLSIPLLTRHLTHLELLFPGDVLDEGEVILESTIPDLLSYLRDAPHLSSLDIDFNPTEDVYNIGNQDLMDVFSTLPLKRLTLSGAHLGNWIYTGDLETVWPNVKYLHMPDQPASPRALSCFAQLPQVQFLGLRVCLKDLAEGPMMHSHCPLRILELSRCSSVMYEPEQLEDIGGFLVTVFPNLYQVVWSHSPIASASRPSAHRLIGFLNKHIALKQEVEKLRREVETLKGTAKS
ncbi:hypothetical protein FS749_008090 [Ceratobasidium sp. UAMH 11750]|nr:hypothetical protein FS749_008090 [Ceratobasidium sp. UAMH 11750]